MARPRRILFFTWRWVLRRFAGVVTELADRGHEVVIVFPGGDERSLPRGLHGVDGVRRTAYAQVSDPHLGRAIALLRHARDYAWYLSPEQAVASHNRRRALSYLVRSATAGASEADPSWPDPALAIGDEDRRALVDALDLLEQRLPPDPGVVD